MGTGFGHLVLLDRDGTLNERRASHVTGVNDLVLLPGAAEAVAAAGRLARVVVVTNQQSVGRGELATSTLELIHKALLARVEGAGGRIDAFYVCPHLAGTCGCRKPADGLFRQALADTPGVAPADCAVVGDQPSDLLPALALGMHAFHVVTGPGSGVTPAGAVEVASVKEAVELIGHLPGWAP